MSEDAMAAGEVTRRQHRWRTYGDEFPDDGPDDDIYLFAWTDGDFHNGPVCAACGRGGCHHCEPEMMNEECPA